MTMKVKMLFLLLTISLFAPTLFAQSTTPQGFSYQAVVRDASGAVLANKPVVFYFDVREGTPQGSAVYSESQEATTNEFGLVNLYVGQGKPAGTNRFASIDWAASSKFLTISLDPGSGLITNLGTSQLMSVPYALYAGNAGGSAGAVTVTTQANGQITGTFDNLQIAQQGAYVGQVLKWDGAKWAPGEDQKAKENGGPDGPTTVPVGAILPWAGPASTVPTGWFLCNGQTVSRTTYAALFNIVGVSWGQGNGTNTFNVPDLRGQFLRGADLGSNNDPNAAQRTVQTLNVGLNSKDAGSKQGDAFQGHGHVLSSASSSYDVQNGIRIRNSSGPMTTKYGLSAASGVNDNLIAKVLGPISDGANGTPKISSETRPKNVNVNYIIKW